MTELGRSINNAVVRCRLRMLLRKIYKEWSLPAPARRNKNAHPTQGVELPSTLAFDYPSVAQIVGFIDRKVFPEEHEALQLLPGASAAPAPGVAVVGVGCRYPGVSVPRSCPWARVIDEHPRVNIP